MNIISYALLFIVGTQTQATIYLFKSRRVIQLVAGLLIWANQKLLCFQNPI